MGALGKVFRYLKPYWKLVLLSIIMLLIVVAFDLLIPRLTQRAIDEGINAGNLQIVISSALLMLGASLLSALFAIINSTASIVASQRFSHDLREALFSKIQRFSFGNLDHLGTGELLVNLTSDMNMVEMAARMLMRIATRAPLMMFGALFMIFRTSTFLGYRVLIIMGVVVVLIGFLIPRLQKLFTSVQQKLDKLNTVLQENLSGMRVVKSFVRQDYESQRFETANEDFTKLNITTGRLMGGLFPLLFFILNIGIVIVVYSGGNQVIQGNLTLGEMIAFLNYLGMVMFPLLFLAMIIGMLASAGASAKRIWTVLSAAEEVVDRPSAQEMPAIKGQVEFKNVSFSYRAKSENGDIKHGDPVLKNINFSVKPGETVAILGATGSGKTSLVNLIARLYEVTEGEVLIDGIDVRDVTQESLQSQIGIALQEAILFSGTIGDNIRYGRPQASEEEIQRAARVAQAEDFINSFAEGYEYHVGERGANLSGGQKQRVSIARAVAMDPAILILDDSTSAVDVDTEARIQEEMAEVLKGRTSFIIAQRISTVLGADKIIVLEDGEVCSVGNHQELMQRCPVYRDIYTSQLGNGGVNNDNRN
ncbi:MAG TPA: ABC transporter ATP-binding protein [Chloroflexi bacterium]|nr:ABC transporter ATP-binding protein [Chloroflexota bacterium]